MSIALVPARPSSTCYRARDKDRQTRELASRPLSHGPSQGSACACGGGRGRESGRGGGGLAVLSIELSRSPVQEEEEQTTRCPPSLTTSRRERQRRQTEKGAAQPSVTRRGIDDLTRTLNQWGPQRAAWQREGKLRRISHLMICFHADPPHRDGTVSF